MAPIRPNKKTLENPNIPEDVVEKILSFLPFKKLCSLSILSKRFRHSWKLCRNLCFDSHFARALSRDECRSIVDSFFNNHSATCADTFKLYYDATEENNLISLWVGKAISLGIKDLELDLTQTDDKVTLNYDLVDVESLRNLKLVNCELHFPMSSNGLRHLREITLQKVMVPPMLTDSVFFNCVSLRSLQLIQCILVYYIKAFSKELTTLVVKDCSDVHDIDVHSPGLRKFHYHGKMVQLRFYCKMQNLSDVILEIAHPRGFQRLSHRNELMNRLATVEILSVTSIFLEGLCPKFENNVYKKMEFFLGKLREFHLVVASESFLNPSDIAIFIENCPTIERLFIDLGRDAFRSSLHWHEYGKKYLNGWQKKLLFLKYVKIKGFAMRELPIYMARFFLHNAKHLHRLILVKARIHDFPMNYNPEELRWGILSDATIEMYNYRADNNAVMPTHLVA